MNKGNPVEIPLSFDCQGAELYGIVHVPAEPVETGLLTVVAGGPQYRAGCGRQLLTLARELASQDIPVMRFDQRGVGDSTGQFLGFENLEDDIRAALAAFKAAVPDLKRVVLWGGCDGASAVLLNAWKFPEVGGAILANPFVTSNQTQKILQRKHYCKRLMQLSFWKKLFSFQYKPLDYLKSLMTKKAGQKSQASEGQANDDSLDIVKPDAAFVDRMLQGFENFQGSVLFLMSGFSPTRREFDEFVRSYRPWAKVYKRASNQRVDLPDADQTFSTSSAQKTINSAAAKWIKALS